MQPWEKAKPSLSDRFWKALSAPLKNKGELEQDFHYAAVTGKIWRAHYLLAEKGVDAAGADNFAIRWAANGGHADIIRMLVSFGADVNAKDGEPLMRALGKGHADAVHALLASGALVSVRGGAPLRIACERKDYALLEKMLSAKEDLRGHVQGFLAQAEKSGDANLAAVCERYFRRFRDWSLPPKHKM